jgi:hypothetical protein
MMKKICTIWLVVSALVVLTTGCKSLFPSEDQVTKTTLTNFYDAEAAFDKIIPHQTSITDLRQMGFDPHTAPNVKILNYLDIIERFIPNQSITKEDLHEDVRACIESKECCTAYEVTLDIRYSKRFGSLFLDMFGFKKKTHITGWNYKALVVIRDDVVTYKLRSGQPNIDRLEKKTKPLGPFQELEGLVSRIPGMF